MERYIDAELLKKHGFVLAKVKTDKDGEVTEFMTLQVDDAPSADVVPKSEEGAECPTCHGTGRIGTTNWLTKNMTQKQIAEEKAKAISEHERHIKAEVAREIFEEIEAVLNKMFEEYAVLGQADCCMITEIIRRKLSAELKKKYTEVEHNG